MSEDIPPTAEARGAEELQSSTRKDTSDFGIMSGIHRAIKRARLLGDSTSGVSSEESHFVEEKNSSDGSSFVDSSDQPKKLFSTEGEEVLSAAIGPKWENIFGFLVTKPSFSSDEALRKLSLRIDGLSEQFSDQAKRDAKDFIRTFFDIVRQNKEDDSIKTNLASDD